jgi:hypothetical protein
MCSCRRSRQHAGDLAQGDHLLLASQLVGLRQQDMNRLAGRRKPAQHLQVEFGQRVAAVHDQDQTAERFAVPQIRREQPFPLRADFFRRLGEAIAGQVDEVLSLGEPEVVEMLGSSGRLETKARRVWLASVLIADDLPEFERPAKAISHCESVGRSRSLATVV